MIVQACLNGARPPSYHPHLPITPAALAADAAAVVAAGAAEIHLHVRAADGSETLAAAAVDATIAAVRDRLPGTLVGVSTGAWIERDEDRRLAAIDAWRILPDYASVNLGEPGAPAVIERLHRRGIGIEAGLASAADAERLHRLGLAPLALRILVEVGEQDDAQAMVAADATLAALRAASIAKPILLHGFDDTVWRFVGRAARDFYSTRVGLEDGAALPDGTPAAGNADLVAAAVALMRPRPP
ncbi:MAG TPA: 3-keto-5-aminohexanoate cleavage protein [Acidisphaera sp.]|nr:3-keto-5-aminohexanoate cleavage protein [Acidisphaera sp.]